MTATAVSIRAASADDADDIVDLYEWLFEPPGHRPDDWNHERAATSIGQVVAGSNSAMLLAESGFDVVGFCNVYLDIESVRFGRRAWVEDLAVHPDHRSQGVGRLLLEEARSWARARNASHLKLESGVARLDAHRFYEREEASRSVGFGWIL